MRKEKFDFVTLIGNPSKAASFAIMLANAGVAACFVTQKREFEGISFDDALSKNAETLYDPSFIERIKRTTLEDGRRNMPVADLIVLFPEEKENESFQSLQTRVDSNPGVCIFVFLDHQHHSLSEDFPEALKPKACGVRFFEPDKKHGLAELTLFPETSSYCVEAAAGLLENRLGKKTIVSKKAGVVERALAFTTLYAATTGLNCFLKPEEIDFLAGKVTGDSKGPFKSIDRNSQEVFEKTIQRLFSTSSLPIEKDAYTFYHLLYHPTENFYREDGRVFNPIKGSYSKREKVRSKKIKLALRKPMYERLPYLIDGYTPPHQFYREFFSGMFEYTSGLIEKQLCRPIDFDGILQEGAGWEMGIFEIWNAIGGAHAITMNSRDLLTQKKLMYVATEHGKASHLLKQGGAREYEPIIGNHTVHRAPIEDIRKHAISEEEYASIYDLGDGIFNIELRGYRNIIEGQTVAAIHRALDLAEQHKGGVIISAFGSDFTVGVNLGLVFIAAIEKNYDYLSWLVKEFQKLNMRLKYAEIPVMILPKGIAIGGGCEMTLHAADALCLPETYIGLPEAKAGLLPAGGGTKELALRLAVRNANTSDYIDILSNLATGKVSTSAFEAIRMNILHSPEQVIFDKRQQLSTARSAIIELSKIYQVRKRGIMASATSPLSAMQEAIMSMQSEGILSSYDARIAEMIASILAAATDEAIAEQGLLDMEREAFLSLCGERETLKRLKRILTR